MHTVFGNFIVSYGPCCLFVGFHQLFAFLPIMFCVMKSMSGIIFYFSDNSFLFVFSVGNCETGVFGAGFYLTDAKPLLICAGCCNNHADSILEAETLALIATLGRVLVSNLHINTIFIANADLHRLIKAEISHHAWRLNPLIHNIADFLSSLGSSSNSYHSQSLDGSC